MSDLPVRALPAPSVNPESRPYWAAANDGKLLLGHCGSCGAHHHYPRRICPFCHAADVEFREASGLGEIYSYSATLRLSPTPYVIAYVTLAEGPTVLTNIVDADWKELAIGQAVKLSFVKCEDGQAAPVFSPVT
jgi:uncharacterized protein